MVHDLVRLAASLIKIYSKFLAQHLAECRLYNREWLSRIDHTPAVGVLLSKFKVATTHFLMEFECFQFESVVTARMTASQSFFTFQIKEDGEIRHKTTARNFI